MERRTYIHAAARTESFGYFEKDGLTRALAERRIGQVLAGVCNDILDQFPVIPDAVVISSQFPGLNDNLELVIGHVVDALRCSGQGANRLTGTTAVRVDTATNGLSPLVVASEMVASGRHETVLVVGGEKLTLPQPLTGYADQGFAPWVEKVVSRIVDVLAPEDREYCKAMPVVAALICNYCCREWKIPTKDYKQLVDELTKVALMRTLQNPKGFQPYHRLAGTSTIAQGQTVQRDNALRNIVSQWVSDGCQQNVDIATPLKRYNVAPFNDGAGALLVSGKRVLHLTNGKTSRADVVVSGIGMAQGINSVLDRNQLDRFDATRYAAAKAYTEANFNPSTWPRWRKRSLIVEHHDAFAPLALLNLQDLYLFKNAQETCDFLRKFVQNPDRSRLHLSPSGGLLEGHPFGGTAIIKTAESFASLTKGNGAVWLANRNSGEPRPWQPSNACTAIVHSFGGLGTSAGVAVLDACSDEGPTVRERDTPAEPWDESMQKNGQPRWQSPRNPDTGEGNGRLIALTRVRLPQGLARPPYQMQAGDLVETVVGLVQKRGGNYQWAFADPGDAPTTLNWDDVVANAAGIPVLVRRHNAGSFVFTLWNP